ncbi:MAG: hypothetical protein IJE78_08495 [Bacteroidaceae bacterium]|nr:hypothetical protein [Bacteroidaceae bacterium]
MKSVKIFASLLFVLALCTASTLENKKKGIFIVGVSASFTDSLIYFTNIQFVDSIELDKNKLLPMRSQYSEQLDNYLEQNLGLNNRTCFIYFDEKKKKLEKTIKKMKEKYQKEGKAILKETGADFKFTKAVEY